MLVDHSIKEYLSVLSSDAPSPGGGSVSAVSGGLGVSIMQMVCSVSMGTKGLEDEREFFQEVYENAESFKKYFLNAIDEDSYAYPRVISAYKMPKDTEEEKKIRLATIQEAYKYAASVPFEIGQMAHKFIALLEIIIHRANKNVITDAYVSAEQILACIDGAFVNVKVNLNYIKDEEFVNRLDEEMKSILEDSIKRLEKVKEDINNMI